MFANNQQIKISDWIRDNLIILGTKVCRPNAEIFVVLSPTRVRKFVRECMRISHQQPITAVLGVCGGQSGQKNLIKNPCAITFGMGFLYKS